MACAHSNQDRYIVMSLPTASRKATHFARWSSAGDATAYPILCLNPYNDSLFAFLQSALYSSPTHITLKSSPAQPTSLGLATVDATKSP
jgi:hypothetical protein